jgi:hypothetical protein
MDILGTRTSEVDGCGTVSWQVDIGIYTKDASYDGFNARPVYHICKFLSSYQSSIATGA